jgi:hypothetical protein
MRKAVLFAIYIIMAVGGGFALVIQLAHASKIWFAMAAGAGAIMALGLYLLWTDFIAPAFGIRTEE